MHVPSQRVDSDSTVRLQSELSEQQQLVFARCDGYFIGVMHAHCVDLYEGVLGRAYQ
jgi:hypothetical protein